MMSYDCCEHSFTIVTTECELRSVHIPREIRNNFPLAKMNTTEFVLSSVSALF